MIHKELEGEVREKLLAIIDHMEHVLPAQAPIKDFVHHNTLHGFQHLHFTHALRSVNQFTGVNGYQPSEEYRNHYRNGRINDDDLAYSIQREKSFQYQDIILETSDQKLTTEDIISVLMKSGVNATTSPQLQWMIEEQNILQTFQADISNEARQQLLAASDEHAAVSELWKACLECLDLDHEFLHPEDHYDLTPERAQKLLRKLSTENASEEAENILLHHTIRKISDRQRQDLWKRIGNELTLRSLLLMLTGHDILDDYRPALLRHIASFLDQGVSSLQHNNRDQGFFAAWRDSAARDMVRHDNELPDWEDELLSLPDDPTDTVMMELEHLGLDEHEWAEYLEQLALEIPGWSGMFLWLQKNPGYEGMTQPVRMIDYLAVRLVLERLYAQRLTRKKWRIDASLYTIHWYFHRRRSELFVRLALFNENLPEFLTSRASRLANQDASLKDNYRQWQQLADMIWAWQHNSNTNERNEYSVYHHGWQLFRLMQLLGIDAVKVRSFEDRQLNALFGLINKLDASKEGYLWLQAYEHNYREVFLHAITHQQSAQNKQSRNNKSTKESIARPIPRPTAQIFFCMDDREEGIRRHLETINPDIETFGVAAFFNLPILWQGIDDAQQVKLSPVTIDPLNRIRETPAENEISHWKKHQKRVKNRRWVEDFLNHESRRNLLSSALSLVLTGPLALLTLIAKTYAPFISGKFLQATRNRFDTSIETDIKFSAETADTHQSDNKQVTGFNDQQQAERVAGFLKTHGLVDNFSPLIVLMGHTSSNQNNPHQSAYGCGACSGKFGGPNGRVFARMANRPEIRERLKSEGLVIPEDCWFIGAMHNTCNEDFDWYDEQLIPATLLDASIQLKKDLNKAAKLSAHERCRKFASAPSMPSLEQAASHISSRAVDFSQARPELGHATIASAVIGRRAVTKGLFLDRRIFLISYDPDTDDEEGSVLERILLTAGPVGAGISLEYYFSTVSNECFGSGSKIAHNVAGFFGVMEGTSSDLRTGLPKQMIEIHEAMRLQLLIEAKTDIVEKIYQRQPVIRELIANEWLLISVIDPDNGKVQIFDPTTGFSPWESRSQQPLKEVSGWSDWYQGKMQPLPPVTLKQSGLDKPRPDR